VPNLSDHDILVALINQTWKLYQQARNPTQQAQLGKQFNDLTVRLGALADSVLDQTQQEYKDAVACVQTATQTVTQAQADEAKVVAAIDQIAQVISALGKLAAMAAA